MKFCFILINFYIIKHYFVNLFITSIHTHYISNSKFLRKINDEQNVIEIEMEENLSRNYTFINLNSENNNKIVMKINNEIITFTNNTQFESNKNYTIKLYLNNFNGSCESMFKDITKIINIKFKNFNICNRRNQCFMDVHH